MEVNNKSEKLGYLKPSIIEVGWFYSGEAIHVSVNSEESIEVVTTHKHGCSTYKLILKQVSQVFSNNLQTSLLYL